MIKRVLKIFAIIACLTFWGASAHAAETNKCISQLAEQLADNISKTDLENDGIVISSDMLIEFFTKNINTCRDYLLDRTSDEDIDIATDMLIMEVHWDYIINEVASALSLDNNQRVLFVCENNRSYMGAFDALMWVATFISSIYSFGAGGTAIQGGKAAVLQGAKSLVKTGSIKGMRKAAITAVGRKTGDLVAKEAAVAAAETAATAAVRETSAAAAAKVAADAAVKEASQKAANNAVIIQARNALQNGAAKKHISDTAIRQYIESNMINGANTVARNKEINKALELLGEKEAKRKARWAAHKAVKEELLSTATDLAAAQAALTVEQALASTALNKALLRLAITVPITTLGVMGVVYSWLSSDLNTEVMNCSDLDKGEGCYLTCSEALAAPTDMLNTKVFKPIFGKNLCVDEETYVLREITSGLPVPGDVFITTQDKWEQAKSVIISKVKDKRPCDWNEDDIDMYIAAPLYDPSTLRPGNGGVHGAIIDVQRLDD